MPLTRRTWLLMIAGTLGLMVLCVVVIAGTAVYFVARHVDIEPASGDEALRQFERELARFEGQAPLIIIEGDDVRLNDMERRPSEGRLEAIHVLVWDPDDEGLARIRLPFWLLRFVGELKLSKHESRFDFERLHVRVDDIERHGPGLILSHTDSDGSRVLVWSE
jgi:hypothetical protein